MPSRKSVKTYEAQAKTRPPFGGGRTSGHLREKTSKRKQLLHPIAKKRRRHILLLGFTSGVSSIRGAVVEHPENPNQSEPIQTNPIQSAEHAYDDHAHAVSATMDDTEEDRGKGDSEKRKKIRKAEKKKTPNEKNKVHCIASLYEVQQNLNNLSSNSDRKIKYIEGPVEKT